MKPFLYRRGDGNNGNFPRALVELEDGECPFAALRALVVNDYIPGRSVRRYITNNLSVDGEAEHGVHAEVYSGPKGEDAWGAAWLTAELQPLSPEDAAHYRDSTLHRTTLRAALDRGALALYRKHAAEG